MAAPGTSAPRPGAAATPGTAVRLGVDLVDTGAFRARFDGRDDVLAGVFTEAELAYCRAQHRPWTHLGARFAAKEATFKALGCGLAGELTWRDVEVVRDPAGAPGLVFRGATLLVLGREGLTGSRVSLSHTDSHAIAVVMLFPG